MTRRAVVMVCAGLALAGAAWVPVLAFDPQPDPPAFGVISVRFGETLQFNVACAEHGAGLVGPRACGGTIMFHDTAGNVLAQQDYRLRPGQALTANYRLPDGDIAAGDGSVRVGIIPCVIPNPLGGRTLPTAELVDDTGRTILYAAPIAPRLSFIYALDIRP
ncbi:MAG: hypothetical protein AB7O28_20750 [Vicinamibacterales bacterium]